MPVQVGHQSVVDLSSEEEPCATAALRIAVNTAGRTMGISKAGSGGLDPTLTQVSLAACCADAAAQREVFDRLTGLPGSCVCVDTWI